MTTINTIEDVLRVVRDDQEVRAALRRELLTEEVLALPQQVSALTKSMEAYRESTDQRISALTKSVEAYRESTDQRISALTKIVEATNQQVSALTKSTEQRISALTKSTEATNQQVSALTKSTEAYREAADRKFAIIVNRLDRQHEMYRRQHDDLARFRGNYAVDAARNSDMEISELFARLRGMRRIQVRELNKDELDEMLNEI